MESISHKILQTYFQFVTCGSTCQKNKTTKENLHLCNLEENIIHTKSFTGVLFLYILCQFCSKTTNRRQIRGKYCLSSVEQRGSSLSLICFFLL